MAILAISACHGDAPRGGTGSSAGSDSTAAAGSSAASGPCTETPLFPARSVGDSGNDLYRTIAVDPATRDVYFADLHTIYRVPATGGEPQVVLPRDKGGAETFWLTPDRLLLAGNEVGSEKVHAVLFATPRKGGGGLEPIIGVPDGDVQTWRNISGVEVMGDDVYWWLEEGTRGTKEEKHTFLTTSWSHPGEPKVLYSTKQRLGGDMLTPQVAIAAGRAYILEERGKTADPHIATVVDLATGATSQAAAPLGGYVIGGDATSILVRRDSFKDGKLGVVRMRPDGSQQVEVGKGMRPRFTTHGDALALADHNVKTSTTEVTVVAANRDPKLVGCVNGDATVHAIGLADDAVYVSAFRKNKATILRFAR